MDDGDVSFRREAALKILMESVDFERRHCMAGNPPTGTIRDICDRAVRIADNLCRSLGIDVPKDEDTAS